MGRYSIQSSEKNKGIQGSDSLVVYILGIKSVKIKQFKSTYVPLKLVTLVVVCNPEHHSVEEILRRIYSEEFESA